MALTTNQKRTGIIGGSILAAAIATTTFLLTSSNVIDVPVGANLQAAIDAAPVGATLRLAPDGVYSCNCTMNKALRLESVGTRPVAAAFGKMFNVGAKIVSPNAGSAVFVPPNTSGVTIDGIEITNQGFIYNIVYIGSDAQKTAEEAPQNTTLNNVWIHGTATDHSQNGVVDNGANTRITDSRIDNIHGVGVESHGILSWNGPGPFYYAGNHVEAAAINIMFGGADPSIPNLIPTGIEVLRNYLFKPLSWKVGDPSYGGIHWSIKNLLEIKMGRKVVIDGNVLENSWGDAQIGYCSLFTVRNQNGKAPWATIEDVTVSNNIFRNCEQGLQLLGKDWPNVSEQAHGLRFFNNQFLNIANRWLTISGYYNVTFEHNTHLQGGNVISFHGEPSLGFTYRNNATVKSGFGIFGDGTGEGNVALAKYAPDGTVQGNVIAGADSRFYPLNNFYPADLRGLADLRGTDGLIPGYIPQLQPSPSPSATATVTVSPPPVASPSSTTSPTPSSPSPEGTRATSIIDSQLKVWTLADEKTLRDGVWMSDGRGSVYKYLSSTVYVLGTDAKWYKWTGASWIWHSNTEPGVSAPSPTPTPIPTATRTLLWPSTESGQTALWQAQAKEGYRPNKHVPRPTGMPKGQYVEFVKY